MTTILPTPPKISMVPTIPSGALPQTPASEWADNMTDLLAGHVTHTPVGTPGPAVPGGFPAHLEPDSVPDVSGGGSENKDGGKPLQEGGTLLETAQATLAAAKQYLPQGIAAYLPSQSKSTSESSLTTPPTAENPVDVGPGANVPYTESGPEPYRKDNDRLDSGASAAFSTTVHTGHSSSAIPPAVRPSGPSTSIPRPTSGLMPSHPGVVPTPATAPDADTPQLSQSPAPLSPDESTDLALKAQSGASSQDSSAISIPQPTSGLLPSHPAAGGAPPSSSANADRAEAPPTPDAVSVPMSMPTDSVHSLDSGYAASTESEGGTQGESAPFTPMTAPGLAVQGGAALNSSRPQDNVPTGDFDAVPSATGAGAVDSQGKPVRPRTSNDSRLLEDFDAPSPLPLVEGEGDHPRVQAPNSKSNSPPRRLPADVPTSELADDEGAADADADEGEVEEDGTDGSGDGDGDGKQRKGKGRRAKLIQRLKEKIHVGAGSAQA